MATTPIYQNGTWGRVIAVDHNGTRVNRPADGQSPWTAPAYECGTVTIPNTEHPEAPVVVVLGKRRPAAIMLPNTDARISPQWAVLVESGDITEEMLATVAQPAEEVLAAAKATAKTAAETWLSNRLADGVSVSFAVGTKRLGATSAATTALAAYLAEYERASAPNETPILLSDVDGTPFPSTFGEMQGLRATFVAAVEALRGQWYTAHAAIEAATTTAGVEAALSGLVGG